MTIHAVLDQLETYEQAKEAVQQVGILPLSDSIPDHPSISALTAIAKWHTGLADDPWQWRVRFATEGSAAYGKFYGGKSFLVAPDLFAALKAWLEPELDIAERYAAGVIPRDVSTLYQLIEEEGPIDARELRKRAGMKAKERKAGYDRALLALSESLEIVIAGAQQKRGADGEVNGWSSMIYTTAERWMDQKDISPWSQSRKTAGLYCLERLGVSLRPKALAYVSKRFKLPSP
jgi:hypothetical protein